MKKRFKIIAAVSLAFVAGACNQSGNMKKQTGFSGEKDIVPLLDLVRDPTISAGTLVIGEDVNWELYPYEKLNYGHAAEAPPLAEYGNEPPAAAHGDTVEAGVMAASSMVVDFSKPWAAGSKGGMHPVMEPMRSHMIFQFNSDMGSAILAERHINQEGGFNFRDMGGIRARDGRYVKWGVVFRADELKVLTDEDLRYLSTIPLRTIVDFRSEGEMKQSPDRIPQSVENVYAYAIAPGNLADLAMAGKADEQKFIEAMEEMNRLFVTEPAIIDQYRKFFAILQQGDKVPLVFHCTAGKDRTGMAAALFLASLGVDKETIMEDYLLSNKYIKAKFSGLRKLYPALAPVFDVRESYLMAGLEKIGEQYGDVETFLTDVLGVDLYKMKRLYLYDN